MNETGLTVKLEQGFFGKFVQYIDDVDIAFCHVIELFFLF